MSRLRRRAGGANRGAWVVLLALVLLGAVAHPSYGNSIATDKPVYNMGETVVFTIQFSTVCASAFFRVIRPDNTHVDTAIPLVIPGLTVRIQGRAGPPAGQRTVRLYCNNNIVAETSFQVGTTAPPPPPHTVSTPNMPAGPTAGNVGQSLTFTASGATCSEGHTVQYRFQWGDGTTSLWGGASRAKTWNTAGTYQVRVQARCAGNVESSWSTVKSVSISVCSVSTPNPPAGPATGNAGQYLTFNASGAACSQNHSVEYQFHWGVNNYSNWSLATSSSNSWASADTYHVRVRARCAVNTSRVSSWSVTRTVTIHPVGPQPLRGYEVIRGQEQQLSAGSVAIGYRVECPPGKVALCGGVTAWAGGNGWQQAHENTRLMESAPVDDGRAWRISIRNQSSRTDARFYGTVMCAYPPPGYRVVTETRLLTDGSTIYHDVTGGPEVRVLGGGVSQLGGPVNVQLRIAQTGPVNDGRSWGNVVRNHGSQSVNVQFHAVVASPPRGYGIARDVVDLSRRTLTGPRFAIGRARIPIEKALLGGGAVFDGSWTGTTPPGTNLRITGIDPFYLSHTANSWVSIGIRNHSTVGRSLAVMAIYADRS